MAAHQRFMRWLVPLSVLGAGVAAASIFLLAAYDWWLHTIDALAFLGALACALAFKTGGRRWHAVAPRLGGGLFLGGVFLALLPLTCG